MFATRRQFLEAVLPSALVWTSTAGLAASLAAQNAPPRRPPNAPRPGVSPFPESEPPDSLNPDPRPMLKKNQEIIKRDAKRLAELARQLEEQIGKTDAADVLSLDVIRTAEQIEKLAKNIKNLARG